MEYIDQFIPMPELVKDIKYPSKLAPEVVITSLDSTVNFGFNLFLISLNENQTEIMSSQFQTAIQNINPSIKIIKQGDRKTTVGNEMSWFEFKGYALDGQTYVMKKSNGV